MKPPATRDRFTPPGPCREGEHALIVMVPGGTFIVKSAGAPIGSMPQGLQDILWKDMLTSALEDMRAQLGKRE